LGRKKYSICFIYFRFQKKECVQNVFSLLHLGAFKIYASTCMQRAHFFLSRTDRQERKSDICRFPFLLLFYNLIARGARTDKANDQNFVWKFVVAQWQKYCFIKFSYPGVASQLDSVLLGTDSPTWFVRRRNSVSGRRGILPLLPLSKCFQPTGFHC